MLNGQHNTGKENYHVLPLILRHRLAWDWNANSFATSPARTADVYVFCLLEHQDPESVGPMNLNQWWFFVIATKEIEAKLRLVLMGTELEAYKSVFKYKTLRIFK